jgi:hypothetical protein
MAIRCCVRLLLLLLHSQQLSQLVKLSSHSRLAGVLICCCHQLPPGLWLYVIQVHGTPRVHRVKPEECRTAGDAARRPNTHIGNQCLIMCKTLSVKVEYG